MRPFVLLLSALTVLSGSTITTAFTTPAINPRIGSALNAAKKKLPVFDKKTQRWTPATPDESEAIAYDTVGTLLRQGPKAYLTRVTNTDQYDQACLKFMAQEGCSYQMAQGNLDRMNENMQDWAFERLEAEKAGRKIDYVKLDTKQIALTVVWAGGIFFLVGRGILVYFTGESFNDVFH